MQACEEYIDLIMRSIDGETTGQEETSLQMHLMSCPGCNALYDSYRMIDDGIYAAQEEPPAALTDAVMNSIHREATQFCPKSRFRQGRFTLIAAAAAVLLLVFSRLGGSFAPPAVTGSSQVSAEPQSMVSAEFRQAAEDPEPAETLEAPEPEPEMATVWDTEEPDDQPDTAPTEGATDMGEIHANVHMAQANTLREQLEEAGCYGTVYVLSGICLDELEALLPDFEIQTLSDGRTVYGTTVEAVDPLLDSLPISESFQIGDGEAWLILD